MASQAVGDSQAYAVAVIRQSDKATVAFTIAFLARDFNKSVGEVISSRMNRGAGYGMEIPCTYRLCGCQRYIDRAKEAMQQQCEISNFVRNPEFRDFRYRGCQMYRHIWVHIPFCLNSAL